MNAVAQEEKPKSLWGYGIMVVYGCFMAMILSIVFLSTGEKMELVTDNYYNEGVDYQKVIDSRRLADSLENKPKFDQNRMKFVIPQDLLHNFQNAQVNLFRPSQADLDKTLAITPNENGEIKLPELKKGAWQIYLLWEDQKQQEYRMQWNIFK